MTIHYADGATIAQANVNTGHAYLNAIQHTGRIRVFYDSFTVGGASVPVGVHGLNSIVLGGGPIPKGSRILGGFFSNDDLGTGEAKIRLDQASLVGAVTPNIEMKAHEAATVDIGSANSGTLHPWNLTETEPYQDVTPHDLFVWVAPGAAETFALEGTMSIAILYAYD